MNNNNNNDNNNNNNNNNCYGDISYHTPKMDSSNLNIFSELARSGKKFDRHVDVAR